MTSRRLLLFTVNRASAFTTRMPPHRPPSPLSVCLYSSSAPNGNASFSSAPSSAKEQHKEYLQQLQELNDERQALFGFTKEEEEAWSNNNIKIHSSTLMDAVEEARKHAEADLQSSKECCPHHPVDYRQEEAVECTAPSSSQSFPSHIHTLQQTSNEEGRAGESNDNRAFTHLDEHSQSVHMVDVGNGKQVTRRIAKAQSRVRFPPEVIAAFDLTTKTDNGDVTANLDLVGPKGPIFATAKVAGIMAAKLRTLFAKQIVLRFLLDCASFVAYCALLVSVFDSHSVSFAFSLSLHSRIANSPNQKTHVGLDSIVSSTSH